MIDIHSHLLFSIDDGAKTIDESIKILKDLEMVGYTDIILTPHYILESSYSSNKENNLYLMEKLKDKVLENKININLYLGNELFINNEIVDLLKKGEISSLHDSSYLLVELPMSGEYENYIDIFGELISMGYKVILAHPERYLAFQKDFHKIEELEDVGVLLQSNLESILGRYGNGAKKMVKRLLKEHKISFLATDIHHPKNDISVFDKARKKILKYIDEGEYNSLVNINPKKIIEEKQVTKE